MSGDQIGALIAVLIGIPFVSFIIWWNVRYIKMQWRTMHALERIAANLEKLVLEKNR